MAICVLVHRHVYVHTHVCIMQGQWADHAIPSSSFVRALSGETTHGMCAHSSTHLVLDERLERRDDDRLVPRLETRVAERAHEHLRMG